MRVPISLKLAILTAAGALLALPVSAGASEVTPLGIAKFTLQPTEQTKEVALGGTEYEIVNEPYKTPFTQAGGHPWALTTAAEFTTEEVDDSGHAGKKVRVPTRDPKDVTVSLPPGLLGNPQAVPRCPLSQVTTGRAACPSDTQIGVFVLHLDGGQHTLGPIVNVTPEAGQSAEFALELQVRAVDVPLLTAHLVHTAAGYGFTVVSNDIPLVSLAGFELTFWGVPGDPSHDAMRGRYCASSNERGESEPFSCSGGGESAGSEVPFLLMPTDCSLGAQTATMRADSWQEPGSVREGAYTGYAEASTVFPAVTGCDALRFDPGIELRPETLLADEPAGLGVNLTVPQTLSAEADGTPDVRDAVVTLPEGMSISPGIVDGIQACEEAGPEGINFEGAESEEVGLGGELQLAPGHCPKASKVGTAEAVTPLLGEPVKGSVFLARPLCGGSRPGEGPCTEQDALDGHLYQLYLELGGKGPLGNAGVVIKAHGYTEANPATGQLTTKFLEDPQAPFSELKIHLNGGPRAPLDNPAACGPAVASADITPWSEPGLTPLLEGAGGVYVPGTPDAVPSSRPLDVEGCQEPTSFAPGFTAGTVTSQAGQFSAFTLNLSRGDREQFVKGVQVHTPPGLLGVLASVPLCEEPQADTGHCPASSKIGTTRVASGAGSHPFEIEGSVYLTGPHDGAPFGLSIVTNAVAGPFNLGLIVVRARIDVDPETSALTVTTDETGPYEVPQIVFGVPLRLQRITVDIDRPGFMFNPTNCAAQQITAQVSGAQQATASVQSPFAVGACSSLAFKPAFTVSTAGRTSRVDGADLDVRLSYPAGSLGSEANIKSVKVELPKQLPSRLTTLQKACAAQVFAANPASCPAASVVGVVKASTPLLPVQLAGPAYFVSHGGEAFPSLIVVLQGDGVRVDLTGSTFISHKGITSSTFKTVPDVPVNTFELYLPEGPYSALAANGNLCKQAGKLVMPTRFTAQNGATLTQKTKIAVRGCAKASRRSRAEVARARRASRYARTAGLNRRGR
jgi:hypothetical protein